LLLILLLIEKINGTPSSIIDPDRAFVGAA
jgi:hypothetical protein